MARDIGASCVFPFLGPCLCPNCRILAVCLQLVCFLGIRDILSSVGDFDTGAKGRGDEERDMPNCKEG